MLSYHSVMICSWINRNYAVRVLCPLLPNQTSIYNQSIYISILTCRHMFWDITKMILEYKEIKLVSYAWMERWNRLNREVIWNELRVDVLFFGRVWPSIFKKFGLHCDGHFKINKKKKNTSSKSGVGNYFDSRDILPFCTRQRGQAGHNLQPQRRVTLQF